MFDDPALKEPPEPPDGGLGGEDADARAEVDIAGAFVSEDTGAGTEAAVTGALETGTNEAGTDEGLLADGEELEGMGLTRSSCGPTLKAGADEVGTTAAATELPWMISVTEEDPASAAADEGRAEIDVTLGRGKDAESSAITTVAGFDERAATTLGAGDAVTGTAWGNAGRLAGPVPITLAKNAVIHPSNASNSCFNCATAAT